MEDRQCKVCFENKPLEEFPPFGVNGKRQFTCNDCQGKNAPIQPAGFVKAATGAHLMLKQTCAWEGCDNLCASDGSGNPLSFCAEHQLEHLASIAVGKTTVAPPKPAGTCAQLGCYEPRAISKGGKTYSYCAEHQRQHQNQYNQAWRDKKASEPSRTTNAQRDAGFSRNEKNRAKILDAQQSVKLCLVDYDRDEMVFIEGTVKLRTVTHRASLEAENFELLLEGHTEDGYIVVERGIPPVAPGIDSALEWRD